MTKDTLKLSGVAFSSLAADETGKDRLADLGGQTLNGLSVRALMTCIHFIKAMAYFRGDKAVTFEDMRQIIPFVLHDKLSQNPDSPVFEKEGNETLRVDRISWIRGLFDHSCKEYERLSLDRDDPVGKLEAQFEQGLEGLTEAETRKRLASIEGVLRKWAAGRKLYGHMYDDILKLKYLHQRYSNYLSWRKWQA
jgi:MoxR-like ATPase